jgi:hypothetical protein
MHSNSWFEAVNTFCILFSSSVTFANFSGLWQSLSRLKQKLLKTLLLNLLLTLHTVVYQFQWFLLQDISLSDIEVVSYSIPVQSLSPMQNIGCCLLIACVKSCRPLAFYENLSCNSLKAFMSLRIDNITSLVISAYFLL